MPSAAATRSRKLHGWLAIAIAAMTHASATCQALSLESFMIRLILGSALPFVAAVLLGKAAGSKLAPAPSRSEADSCSEPGATRIETRTVSLGLACGLGRRRKGGQLRCGRVTRVL